jgi:curved DNA-binding protein CbpA
MSSSVGGKFQDHYIVLGVEPNADSQAIRAAHAKLTEKYAGDKGKLDNLNQAFEVLCDPDLRASFDKVKGVDLEVGGPKFTGPEFFEALEQSAGLRAAILCILYDRRRVKSFKPSLSMRHLDGMLHVKGEALNFALWYLKKRSFVVYDDKSAMEITVEGMDFLEQNRPSPDVVLHFIKPESLAHPVKAPITEPVLNVLGRALSRTPPAVQPRVTLEFK